MPDNPRRRQHLVSKGYQQNFADRWHVAVVDAHSGAVIDERRLTRENWVVDDFTSIMEPDGSIDDSLEREFAKREQRTLNVIRGITVNAPVSADQKTALDDLAALHLTRSRSFAEAHKTAVGKTLDEAPSRLSRDPRAMMAFARQHGRAPSAGELEAIVARAAREFAEEPDLFMSGVRRVDPVIQQLLRKWTVQLVGVADALPGFILPDNPVLHGRRTEGRFGFRDAVAIGDADTIIVPISRRLAALYSGQPLPSVHIYTKASLRWINSLLVRSALNEVACHPEDAQETSWLIANLDRYPPDKFDTVSVQ